jgi:multiple sugar transport system permease protein
MNARRSLLCWGVLTPLLVLNLFPFAVMLATAVKPGSEVVSAAPSWLPSRIAWENAAGMWNSTGFGGALANSLYVATISTCITILVSVPAAYAMARYRFYGRGGYRSFLLVTQMLSPIVLVPGLFRLAVLFGMLQSLNALVIVYAAFHIAFAVWMLQNYFSGIPAELEEAASLDGATRVQTMLLVFMPLSAPGVAVTAVFSFVAAWNEFGVALTLIGREDRHTLPVQIFSLVAGRYSVEWHYVMAATLLATVPVAAVFLAVQRYMVRGLALGAIK